MGVSLLEGCALSDLRTARQSYPKKQYVRNIRLSFYIVFIELFMNTKSF